MNGSSLLVAAALVAGATACTSGRQSAPAEGPQATMSLEPTPEKPSLTFSGRFRPVLNTMSGDATLPGAIRIQGTAKLVAYAGTDDQFRVQVRFTSELGAQSLRWSIVAGNCGSGSLPLVPPHNLTTINVDGTGRVVFDGDFRSTLTAGRSYHLNLYGNNGNRLADVVGCANLRS